MANFIIPDAVNQSEGCAFVQAPSPCMLTRLRLETRNEHNAVERVLDLMGASLTRHLYCRRLAQFYGFYAPLEAALQIRCALPGGSSGGVLTQLATLSPRLNKTRLLQQDLRYLNVADESLPLCPDLPSLQTSAEVLGCMYVLEGATLGGRVITQHVQARLGISATTGGSFFVGYAGDTAKMWSAMRQMLLNSAVDAQTEDATVASAIATFTCLRDWCESASFRDAKHTGCDVNNNLVHQPKSQAERNQRA